ncbi:histidine kinase [Tetzosporium hominis]|uniref:Histidine kinase n=1 Tax=Tetzosporium hominis TaxID=2020506 RepID=A0A264W400_9BACL|nr:sensor histidine kinase [Tetzosporium hominis]OZS78338.1 histidine kinase [Tetzosporium hominis]
MKNTTLQFRIMKYMLALTITVVILVITASYFVMAHSVKQEIGERALNIAETTAQHPDVIRALQLPESTPEIQQLALDIQQEVKAQYVVIGDENEIRYAHPITERIGQKMVGEDNDKALLEGQSYISEATGTLGRAIRGKAPVIDDNGTIIGVVSVGFLQDTVFQTNLQYAKYLVLIFAIAALVAMGISQFLTRRIKHQLLDYEPEEIVSLLTQRNALLASIREAIIVTDTSGQIVLSNPAADAFFPGKTSIQGLEIQEIIPNTRLLDIMKSGQTELDKVMVVGGNETLVNRIPIVRNGEVTGAIASFRKIEDIDTIAEELAQTKQYSESLRAQTHEHQNFLYMISGLLQLQEYEEAVDLIHQQQTENASLITFISRHIQEPYISAMVIGFYNRARELKVDLELDEDSSCGVLPSTIEKHLLLPVISNLITNAFEAVEKLPLKDRKVRIYVKDTEKELVVEIEDSGEGIDVARLPELLKGKQSTKDAKTRGYGLAIVQENVALLNATLSLENGDLGGALFVLAIPKEDVPDDTSH